MGDLKNKEKIIRAIKNIVIFIVFSTVLYGLCYLYVEGKSFMEIAFKDWLFLNVTSISDHLWYLYAYLYVLVVFYLRRWGLRKMDYLIIVSLLSVNYFLGKYSIVFFGKPLYLGYVRNFLFTGIPLFTIGLFIKQQENKLKNFRLKNLLIALSITILLLFLEKALLYRNGVDSISGDLYIFNTIVSIILILVIVKINESWHPVNDFKMLARHSLYLYIFHVFIYKLILLNTTFEDCGLYTYILPFIVVFLTTIFSVFLIFLMDNLKQRIKYL